MKRVFLSFLHDDIWEVDQFRVVIGNEYVGAMAYGESLKNPVKSLRAEYVRSKLDDMINRASLAILLVSEIMRDPSGWLDGRYKAGTWKQVGAMKFKNAPYARDPAYLSKFKITAGQWSVDTIRRWMAD